MITTDPTEFLIRHKEWYKIRVGFFKTNNRLDYRVEITNEKSKKFEFVQLDVKSMSYGRVSMFVTDPWYITSDVEIADLFIVDGSCDNKPYRDKKMRSLPKLKPQPEVSIEPIEAVEVEIEEEKNALEEICAEKCQIDFIVKLKKLNNCKIELNKSFALCMNNSKKGKNLNARGKCKKNQQLAMLDLLPEIYIDTGECTERIGFILSFRKKQIRYELLSDLA